MAKVRSPETIERDRARHRARTTKSHRSPEQLARRNEVRRETRAWQRAYEAYLDLMDHLGIK